MMEFLERKFEEYKILIIDEVTNEVNLKNTEIRVRKRSIKK